MVAKWPGPGGIESFADLHARLGFVPLSRIGFDPPPGTATEADVVRHLSASPRRLYELIDGTLVEKAVGTWESILAIAIATKIKPFVDAGKLGLVSGADGPFRMLTKGVRYPDVAFIPRSALPDGRIPREAVWSVIPALAVEVLSESNTADEIDRKIGELFALGTRLIWIVDPKTQTARVYTSEQAWSDVEPTGQLPGGDVLPGFSLPMTEVFEIENEWFEET